MYKSLYVHIPFCKNKCPYCDFYSIIYNEDLARPYIDILLKQIEELDNILFSTIYVGGGTPTVLSKDLLEKLLGALKKKFSKETEFTIEANPESLNQDKLALFLDYGVNRLSLGVQSLSDAKLQKLGRIHSVSCAKEALFLAQKLGFKNLSIDLIFGLWDETPDDWKKELENAIALAVEHISCYSLTYEEGTQFSKNLKEGRIKKQEDDAVAKMYEWTIDYLSKCGYSQYEVSNFARRGYACKHNLNYWENNSYFGLGAASVSYLDNVRSKNIADVEEFIRRYEARVKLSIYEEKLSPEEKAKETAALKIRTKEGIDYLWFEEKTEFSFTELQDDAILELIEDGLIEYKQNYDKVTGVKLTKKGFLFCDRVSSAFL